MNHVSHRPWLYVSGIYVRQKEEWLGKFEASPDELYHYAQHDAATVAEYELLIDMITAQQTYELWWSRVSRKRLE